MKIIEKITKHLQLNLPFAVYKKPNEYIISGFFQTSNKLFNTNSYTEEGFIFAPFNNKEKTIIIPKKEALFLEEKIHFLPPPISISPLLTSDEISKNFHIKIVDKAIQAIINKEFEKVVLSRIEKVKKSHCNSVDIFKNLVHKYPSAMTYIWFHPKVGLWLGATPETLLKSDGKNFETMALAGTQVYKNTVEVQWQEKEIEEQKVVTDYILNTIKPMSENLTISKVKTVRAGNLLHLQTKITGTFKEDKSLLISCLHPTPAVCGFPKKESKEFIEKNELYDRTFYTGFLGDIKNQKLELFVNLRCMQIKNNEAIIYVGGGITKDSNPHKEWEETIAKAQIMRSVL